MLQWKADITDLRNRALAVTVDDSRGRIGANAAAQALSGVVRFVSCRFGEDAMRAACAALVRYDAAWRTSLRVLPRGMDGRTADPVAMLAAAGAGLLQVAGPDATRAALSFWASESDASVLQRIAG